MAKFNIDDIVVMKDEFHFNPTLAVTSVGKVEAIHFHKGGTIVGKLTNRARIKNLCTTRITYSISGFSLRPDEDQLILYKGGDPHG